MNNKNNRECIEFNQQMSDVNTWVHNASTSGHAYKEIRLNDDLEIAIYFNIDTAHPFFYLSLHYKGIDILPYSLFVDYYYADSNDIANYTRRYEADRSSWDYALTFIKTITDKIKTEGNHFVEEMLREEIFKLQNGIRRIIANPLNYIDHMVIERNKEIESHYYSVRHMTVDEEMRYRAYPHEMMFVLMAEKISGALAFVEGIMRLEQIDSSLHGVSDEIVYLSKKLYPALEKKISTMKVDVEELQSQEDSLKSEINNLQEMIDLHSAANSDCSELLTELQRATSKRTDICLDRCNKMSHITRLEECRATLDKYKYP